VPVVPEAEFGKFERSHNKFAQTDEKPTLTIFNKSLQINVYTNLFLLSKIYLFLSSIRISVT